MSRTFGLVAAVTFADVIAIQTNVRIAISRLGFTCLFCQEPGTLQDVKPSGPKHITNFRNPWWLLKVSDPRNILASMSFLRRLVR
jgi:hypothetical protein